MPTETDNKTIRKFETGATRDTAEGKFDYEGFLAPTVLEAFAAYMHKNRKQSDGSLRDSDNWQKGIPQSAYIKSGWRHFFQWWKLHRGLPCRDEKGNAVTLQDAICGLLFNAMGYLFESLKKVEANRDIFKELQKTLHGMQDQNKVQQLQNDLDHEKRAEHLRARVEVETLERELAHLQSEARHLKLLEAERIRREVDASWDHVVAKDRCALTPFAPAQAQTPAAPLTPKEQAEMEVLREPCNPQPVKDSPFNE